VLIKHAEYGVGIATGKSGVYEVEQFMVVGKFSIVGWCLPCLLILAATGIENPERREPEAQRLAPIGRRQEEQTLSSL